MPVTPCDFEASAGERRKEDGRCESRYTWPMIREIDSPRGLDFMAGSVQRDSAE